MKEKNYDQTLKGIEELLSQYRAKPITKKGLDMREVMKKGTLYEEPEGWQEGFKEPNKKLIDYQNRLGPLTMTIRRLEKFVGPAKVDKEYIETIVEVAEKSYEIGERIEKEIREGQIPEGYGHEVLFLETARKAYELSKKAAGVVGELKPYEGKSRFFMLKGLKKE